MTAPERLPAPGGSLRLGGGVDILAVPTGRLYVDGRAMFGDLSRAAWEADYPADGRGRAALALNVFLIRTPDAVILADTGLGDGLDPRLRKAYGFEPGTGLVRGLREAGVGPEDVDLVFHSHLHFDHCGGSTSRVPDGRREPAFPRARYVVAAGEWAFGLHPSGPDKPSYLPGRLRPLADSGRLLRIDGPAELAPGVMALPLPGHTAHHQGLVVTGGGRTFCFTGDAAPTSMHLGRDVRMSFDLDPGTAAAARRDLAKRAAEGDWLLGFYHDARRPFGRVRRAGRSGPDRPADPMG